MDGCPGVGKELLSPAAQLVAGSVIGRNFLDSVAIANPIEVAAPYVGVYNGEGPSACGDFADEGVVGGFGDGATAGGRVNGLESGGGEGCVECDGGGVTGDEERGCVLGGGGVFGLHENEGHGGFGPVSLEEDRKRAVEAVKRKRQYKVGE